MNRSYSRLINLKTFEERFHYLCLSAKVGDPTFGGHRWLNQSFYTSSEWRRIRDYIIVRDEGCDLAMIDRPIFDSVIVHHLNPVTQDDLDSDSSLILDPENLVCVSLETHNAIHYGDTSILMKSVPIERTPNDTCPWKRGSGSDIK